jgi:hypothetical protein
MAHSLDDAIAENNRWQQQVKDIDKKWDESVRGPAANVPPPAPTFNAEIEAFKTTHAKTISEYANFLKKTAYGSGNEQFVRYRASHLQLLLDLMLSNPHKLFRENHDRPMREALLEGANTAMSAYSSDHAVRLRVAADEIEKLSKLYTADHGPML